MKLKDQVAIVTGAGRNIGEEIARLFAAEGAKVAIVDMDKARGERVAGAITAAGGEAALFLADVSSGREVAALVEAVVARFGRIDILVNNVAISDNKHIFEITEEEWDQRAGGDAQEPVPDGQSTLASRWPRKGAAAASSISARPRASWEGSARSPIRPPRAASPISRARWRRSLRRTTSGSTRSCPTRSARRSARTSSIRTRPVPNMAKRPGQPAEAARAVLFLVSEDFSFVYGANLFVDGGVSAMDLS